ncbi:GlsB/YeaQ/YmgE family stress response membrane protein [Novosphingobium sp.]|uniref:GlsB/YeaQ/YmgE family stress response membrane protein n=1 Tax=Novosphingobium sp. TaxID=1874826 RepID=UPI0026163951|nr:GlsB/YeaQ/YmgE family stress response membrane protein [Novosphingobium sp.]
MVVGIAGSSLGGLLLAPALGISSLSRNGEFSPGSLGIALGGTIILLALWNLLNKGSVR